MKATRLLSTSLLVLTLTCAARADLGIALGVKGGSLGAGVELSKSLWGPFAVRAAMNQFTYSMEDSMPEKDMAYTTDIELSSWSVIVDWHPWDGVFRLSGGVINNGNNFVAKITSTETYTVGGRSFTPETQGELNATIEWEPMAPYIGLGWGNSTEKDKFFGVNVDIGAMFQNSPKVTLKGTKMMEAMEAEGPKIEKHLEGAKTWLVASLGFSFHF
jgi:hypothetical protein